MQINVQVQVDPRFNDVLLITSLVKRLKDVAAADFLVEASRVERDIQRRLRRLVDHEATAVR